MKRYKVTQTRSGIGHPKRQKATLTALGFRKMNQTIEVNGTPELEGMINAVRHLVRVEEI